MKGALSHFRPGEPPVLLEDCRATVALDSGCEGVESWWERSVKIEQNFEPEWQRMFSEVGHSRIESDVDEAGFSVFLSIARLLLQVYKEVFSIVNE